MEKFLPRFLLGAAGANSFDALDKGVALAWVNGLVSVSININAKQIVDGNPIACC